MEYRILSTIKSPDDVKKLNSEQLDILCDEIRDCIIDTVSKNGGHLASNLGAVELTVALHRVFSSPKDAIIFDVGHQSYTHKLLTGRFDKFSSIRTTDGISGFMRPQESEHDAFVTGHSSNSISAAFGIHKANQLQNSDATAVAVIGDGAMTGGMAYEAINNAGSGRNKFVVVLNDNKMSISRNVGAVSRGFNRMRSRPRYHKFKFAVTEILEKIPLIGKPIYRFLDRAKDIIKNLVYGSNIFTAMGFTYLGPVDGHNIHDVEELLRIARTYNRPTLVHVITTKGKGYSYAESKPKNYHGVSPFDIDKGASESMKVTYSDIAGKALCDLAEDNPKICAVTAAMTQGTGLTEFSQKYKNRFFDVGIAEQHAVTFSAGLAKGGMIPFFAVYSAFLQRGFDQIIHDAAIANLPLKLLVDRAGIVGEDGESHQGVFDAAYLSEIPNMNVYSPTSFEELEFRIKQTAQNDELCAIRYPRGAQKDIEFDIDYSGDYSVAPGNKDLAVVTYGRLFYNVLEADVKADLIKLNKIYPIGKQLVEKLTQYKMIHFFEEGIKNGGIAEHILADLTANGYKGEFHIHAVGSEFLPSCEVSVAMERLRLDSKSIKRTVTGEAL